VENILNWIAVITGGAAILAVIWRFIFNRGSDAKEKEDMKRDIQELKDNMKKMTEKVDDVETCAKEAALKIEPFWNVINTNLPNLLNLSHSENMINKLSDGRITNEELAHLEEEVKEKLIADRNSGSDVFVDLMALWAIEIRKSERGLGNKFCSGRD
jgi:hypothetical protein